MYRIVTEEHPPLPESASPVRRALYQITSVKRALMRSAPPRPPAPALGRCQALRDFLMQCFQKDCNLRVSASKLLRHPWLQKTRKDPAGAVRLHTGDACASAKPIPRHLTWWAGEPVRAVRAAVLGVRAGSGGRAARSRGDGRHAVRRRRGHRQAVERSLGLDIAHVAQQGAPGPVRTRRRACRPGTCPLLLLLLLLPAHADSPLTQPRLCVPAVCRDRPLAALRARACKAATAKRSCLRRPRPPRPCLWPHGAPTTPMLRWHTPRWRGQAQSPRSAAW